MNEIQKKIIASLTKICDAIDYEHINSTTTIQAELLFDETGYDFIIRIYKNGQMNIIQAQDEKYAENEIQRIQKQFAFELVGTDLIDDHTYGSTICDWCNKYLTNEEAMQKCPEYGGQACPYACSSDIND